MRRYVVLACTVALLASGCGVFGDDDVDPTSTPTGAGGDVPLIFVPGAAGTRLESIDGKLWTSIAQQVADPIDSFLLALRLDGDGISPAAGLTAAHPGDIIRSETLGFRSVGATITAEVYSPIIERFTAEGYEEHTSLFIYPYDWRLDPRIEGERLRGFIDQVLALTGAARVDIVAHSMGGLVALWALGDTSANGKVRRFVTLGTPLLGATKALGVIEYRAICFTVEIVRNYCMTNETTAQKAVATFPGAYALLPSPDFDVAVSAPLKVDGVEQGYAAWSAIVAGHFGVTRVNDAEVFHAGLPTSPADPNVEMLRIVESRLKTSGQIVREMVNDCYLFSASFCPAKTTTKVDARDGDGTVPQHSADLSNPATGFDRTNGITTTYVADLTDEKVSHMDLVINEDVLDAVIIFLSDSADIEGKFASLLNPPVKAVNARPTSSDEFEGVEITVVGALWGYVADDEGRRTGPVVGEHPDVSVAAIPGSSYDRISGTQQFFFEEEGNFTAEYSILAPNSVEFNYLREAAGDDGLLEQVGFVEVRRYEEGQAVSRLFRVDPVPGMQLHLTFDADSNTDELSLEIDRDGDGEYEGEAPVIDCYNCPPPPNGDSTPEPDDTPTASQPTEVARRLVITSGQSILPALIEKWDPNDAGNQITLVLQPDVILANGTPFDSRRLLEILKDNAAILNRFEYLGGVPRDELTAIVQLGTTADEEFVRALGEIEVVVLE